MTLSRKKSNREHVNHDLVMNELLKEDLKRMCILVPEGTLQKFKILSTMKGKTMSSLVNDFIKRYIYNNSNLIK